MIRRRTRKNAFTVVEMLIAVGAVALIGVGLAQLFQRTGETVRIGRRVSAMNEYAALLERTMRADFAAMTRDGFLVIRHRDVGQPDGSGILLSRTDRAAEHRRRRVDQIAFFTEGSVSSLRDPLSTEKFPSSGASRVWYGHGLSRPGDTNVSLDDDNAAALSFGEPSPNAGEDGPAQFAGAWMLLRHQTVLARPQLGSVPPATPVGIVSTALANEWGDSSIQVGLQPASPSIFRNERLTPLPNAPWARLGEAFPSVQPNIASGIVDVAAMDLSQVRARLLATGLYGSPQYVNPKANNIQPISTEDRQPLSLYTPGREPRIANSPAQFMKEWMAFGFPAGPRSGVPDEALTAGTAPERRMRFEVTPPDYLGTVAGASHAEPWQFTDQLMLSSGNLVPGCTEFVVEWTFGQRFGDNDPNGRAGQFIWHGLPRYLDLDDDGLPDATDNTAKVADIYLGRETASSATSARDAVYQRYDHQVYDPMLGRHVPSTDGKKVASELIHMPYNAANSNTSWPQGRALYSCFGYVDPSYSTIIEDGTTVDPTKPDAIAWPWPKLIRVTMSLVDASEPNNEQTYQFVFEVPDRQAAGAAGTAIYLKQK